jgi:hypothetical protein
VNGVSICDYLRHPFYRHIEIQQLLATGQHDKVDPPARQSGPNMDLKESCPKYRRMFFYYFAEWDKIILVFKNLFFESINIKFNKKKYKNI